MTPLLSELAAAESQGGDFIGYRRFCLNLG